MSTANRTLFQAAQETDAWKAANAALEAKRQAAIEYLGDKWILAKANHVQKKVSK